MRIDACGYSPRVLDNVLTVAGELKSFDGASRVVKRLLGVSISGRHVGRLARGIGLEMAAERDAQAARHAAGELPSEVENVPDAVAVEIDGGRIRTRTEGQGPGVHGPAWREDKCASLMRLQSQAVAEDPHPQLPRALAQPEHVRRLVQEVKRLVATPAESTVKEADQTVAEEPPLFPKSKDYRPRPLVRTVVASMAGSDRFGELVAAEAQRRGFYRASRRAFVADGQKCNWTIHQRHFRDFVPIVDFIHAITYVYAAAMAVDPAHGWRLYLEWATACWQGRIAEVLAALRAWTIDHPTPDAPPLANDPHEIVRQALGYLGNNAARMDYPRYRRDGLPVTSTLVESLIKEINYRVKGTEKFWDDPDGAEAILQIRAALLSEDEPLYRFLANRPGNPFTRRSTLAATCQ